MVSREGDLERTVPGCKWPRRVVSFSPQFLVNTQKAVY